MWSVERLVSDATATLHADAVPLAVTLQGAGASTLRSADSEFQLTLFQVQLDIAGDTGADKLLFEVPVRADAAVEIVEGMWWLLREGTRVAEGTPAGTFTRTGFTIRCERSDALLDADDEWECATSFDGTLDASFATATRAYQLAVSISQRETLAEQCHE